MTKCTIEYAFSMYQRVKLLDVDRIGVIEGLMSGSEGKFYQVRYWHNGDRKMTWVKMDEIVEAK